MNFQTICRICVTNNLELISIFEPYNFSVDSCEIFKVITNCASVQITQCDGFSEKICRRCLDNLCQAYRFKKLCEESDYKFRNNLILSDEIVIKNEIYEEPIISYGAVHSRIKKNAEEKSEITNFEFIDVKQEQHDDKIRIENISDKEEVGKEQDAPQLRSLLIQEEYNDITITENKSDEEEDELEKEEQDSSRLRTLLIQSEPSSLKKAKKSIYKCDICEKLFKKKSNLVHHNRLHTGERPYKCKFCEKTYISSSNLNVHIRLHTGELRYNCEFCEKKFKYRSNLTRHIRLHNGEKRYKCDFCEKKFADESNLANHIRIHTGEKPYECQFCQKKFTQSGSLSSHVSRIHVQNK